MKKRAISLALVLILCLYAVCFAGAAATRDFELEYQWNLAVFSSKSADESAYFEHALPSSAIQSDDPGISALALSIVQNADGDYEKAKAIYRWVSGNVWYDWDSLEDSTKRGVNSALETLQNRRAVCLGYANLTVALLRAAGVPSLVAAGHAVGESRVDEVFFDFAESFRNGNHVWAEAYIDGRWVIMDVTWATNNKFQHGKYSKRRDPNHEYFDITLYDLSRTHKYSLNYMISPYPVIEFTVPYGVETVADYAFWRNESLERITIPGSVASIGYAAFGHCSNLKAADLPDSIKSISDYAFYRCTSLEDIAIPASVTSIGKYAFSGCTALKSIYIPASVASIETNAFMSTTGVTITGSAGSYAQAYARQNGIPFKAVSLVVP